MAEADILEVFIGEAREIIERLESDIVLLEENPGNGDIINSVFRSFHTLKGSSGIAGINSVYNFTHKVESLVDEVRSGRLSISDSLIDLILGSIDWIRTEIFDSERKGPDHDDLCGKLQERIKSFLGDGAVREPAAKTLSRRMRRLKPRS